jgi:hypothetical protein
MTTDRDVREQIINTLGDGATEYDVDGLVDGFIARYGCVDISATPALKYWELVIEHKR